MSDSFTGQISSQANVGAYNEFAFVFSQLLGRRCFCAVVQVVACSNSGGVAAAGTVDVQPLVNQVDGLGNAVPHGVVHGLPYQRLIGGSNAVILDPQVGDIGVCVFADRDISSVKATQKQANPASRRRNNWSDGVYLGGILNGVPSQFVQFNGSGITVQSPTKVTVAAPDIEMNASSVVNLNAPTIGLNGAITQTAGGSGSNVTLIGPVNVVNDVTAVGTSVHTHLHRGVTPGTGNTGTPV